ncbi:unnamed protein product [Ceutorhynchus assimilis]|uniref:Ionotropic receptor n=1 Tax=Ceutorhynchus assimilis TaxID=467358 RepID=A0A9N9MGV3_9CUCU|nr:unnamed protein product [Ceutorhynchus assimilis]
MVLRATLFIVIWAKLKTPSEQPKCSASNNAHKVFLSYFRQAKYVEIFKFHVMNKTAYEENNIIDNIFENANKQSKIQTINVYKTNNEDTIDMYLKTYSVIKVTETINQPREIRIKQKFYNSISFEPHLVQLIIVDNPITLYNYLKSNPIKLKHLRGLNIIIFASNKVKIKDVQDFLIFYWEKYGELNVIVRAPASCKLMKYFVLYKPFEPTEFGYGQIQIHHLDNLLKNNIYLLVNHAARLHGYPLKISLFERYPLAFKNLPKLLKDSEIYKPFINRPGLYGTDAITMGYLSIIMNFSINLCTHIECQYFGTVLDNKTVIGSLSKVDDRTIDIQGNSRFILDYEVTDNVEFTYPYDFAEFCIVLPKAPLVPVWLKMLGLFKKEAGISLLIVILLIFICNKYLNGITFWDSAMDIYSIFIWQPAIIFMKRTNHSIRIFIGSSLLFSLLITTVLTASLYSALQTKIHFPDAQTLQEVDESNIKIISTFDPFAGNPSKIYKQLSKKITVNPKLTTIFDFVLQGLGAGLERYKDGQFRINTEYSLPDGSPLMHIVPECPKKVFLGYLVSIRSPYLQAINYYLKIMTEAGLSDKWHQDFMHAIKLERHTHLQKTKDKRRVLDLRDLQIAFYILGYGLGAGFLVFLVEVFKYRYGIHLRIINS